VDGVVTAGVVSDSDAVVAVDGATLADVNGWTVSIGGVPVLNQASK